MEEAAGDYSQVVRSVNKRATNPESSKLASQFNVRYNRCNPAASNSFERARSAVVARFAARRWWRAAQIMIR
jgi:hypothetical protein